MCTVIFTARYFIWALMSIMVCLAELASMLSAHWLISEPNTRTSSNFSKIYFSRHEPTVQTLGLFTRCHEKEESSLLLSSSEKCSIYAQSLSSFASAWWGACCVFMAIGILLLFIVSLFSVWALCFRSVCGRKSIFSISGVLQAIAGEFGKIPTRTKDVVFSKLIFVSKCMQPPVKMGGQNWGQAIFNF